jgi:hypothetical protein
MECVRVAADVTGCLVYVLLVCTRVYQKVPRLDV